MRPDGVTNPLITEAVAKIIDAIDNLDAVVPNKVDFVEFMMHLSGNAAEMDGTAVSADELWSLGENDSPVVAKAKDVLAGIPNGGHDDHRRKPGDGFLHRPDRRCSIAEVRATR